MPDTHTVLKRGHAASWQIEEKTFFFDAWYTLLKQNKSEQ